jgi:hypothetical protein
MKYQPVEIGTKLNRLTVISGPFTKNGRKELWLKVICECTKEKEVRKRDIVKARVRSCGCLQKEFAVELCKPTMTGEESAVGMVYSKYKSQAKDRELAFTLTKADFVDIVKEECHYCKCLPIRAVKSQSSVPGIFICHGIDRVDNKVGYELTNVVSCCADCNYMKGTLSYQEFIDKCKTIANNFGGQ